MQPAIINCCKVLLVCLVIVSCGRGKEEEKLFEELNLCLESSNKTIDAKSRNFLFAINEKMKDAKTHDHTAFWKPKADSIDKFSVELINYIDSLKNITSRKLNEGDLKKLYNKLIIYKQKIQLLDSVMYKDLSKDIQITTELQNADEQTEIEFCKSFNISSQLLNLAIYKNRIIKIKAALLEYCNMQTTYTVCSFDSFQAIASQNSTHFKPNETLEITAGIGAFSKSAMPLITVDGKPILLNADGVAEYKTKVADKKGKFSKLVKIEYRKPDGTAGSAEKEIIYTVDE